MKKEVFAILGLIFGTICLVFSIINLIFILSLFIPINISEIIFLYMPSFIFYILVILTIIFSVLGMKKNIKNKAIIGLIFGIVSLSIRIICGAIVYFKIF